MTEYVIGCTHFGHAGIIDLANRPFENVDHMNRSLVQNWNRVVRPGDTIYHLGDFAWSDHLYWADQLNGTLVLIGGNHDRKNPMRSIPYLEIRRDKKLWCLFHYPIEEWNGWYSGSFHVHCHTHDQRIITAPGRFNCTVEANNYAPISLEKVRFELTKHEATHPRNVNIDIDGPA